MFILKRIFLLFCFTPLSIATVLGQDFYDITKIQEIKIYFTQTNWVVGQKG
jgi:hypothetical protein